MDHQNQTPEQKEKTDPTRPERSTTRPDATTGWAKKLHDNAALIPWSAGLIAAGVYQSDLAHDSFKWSYPWALVFPLAIECGIAWSAGNFHRRLINRDSAIGARLGFLALTAFSCSLLFWHANNEGLPFASAAGISAMSVIAAWIWTQRASLRRRDIMRQRNLIYPSIPNYPLYRWILCPIETPRALRYGVKHGIDDPMQTLEAFRNRKTKTIQQQSTHPEQITPKKDALIRSQTNHSEERRTNNRIYQPEQTNQISPDSDSNKKGQESEQTKPRPVLISVDDLTYINAIKASPDWPKTSLKNIAKLVAELDPTGTCGQSRAIRLRDRAQETTEKKSA